MSSQIAVRSIAALSPSEARSLEAFTNPAKEAQRLQRVLSPASPEDVAQAIGFLFKVLPMENAGSSEDEKDEIMEAQLAAYGEALRGYPRWAIIEARSAFIAGLVKGFNGRFAPTPPELGRECAARVDAYREKLGRMQKQAEEVRALEAEQGYGPLSPEARAYGERRISELRAAALAERQQGQSIMPGYVDPNPITPEALEAASVPDAPPRNSTGSFAKLPDAFQMLKAG